MGGGALENMFACLFVFPAHCTNFVFLFFSCYVGVRRGV